MRKTVIILAVCISIIAQAKVLRVNNVAGMAPYQSIKAAISAAADGDTIMVDGSATEYDDRWTDITINKKVVLMGPGYLLYENGIGSATSHPAYVYSIVVTKPGVTIMGLWLKEMLTIKAANTVVTRCCYDGRDAAQIEEGANNCVFHQNFSFWYGVACHDTSNHQFTNNIIMRGEFTAMRNSYVGYNTFCDVANRSTWSCEGNIYEKNLVRGWEDGNWKGSNTYQNEYYFPERTFLDANNDYPKTDKQVQQRTPAAAQSYGAFAGDDPYRLSGIPAGPIIESLSVPASVEKGSNLKVTIKLGKQQ